MAIEKVRRVLILYTNWKGNPDWRLIIPLDITFGSNEWHPEPEWLLDAYDCEKKATRTFAMKDISEWKEDELVDFDSSVVK